MQELLAQRVFRCTSTHHRWAAHVGAEDHALPCLLNVRALCALPSREVLECLPELVFDDAADRLVDLVGGAHGALVLARYACAQQLAHEAGDAAAPRRTRRRLALRLVASLVGVGVGVGGGGVRVQVRIDPPTQGAVREAAAALARLLGT